MTSYTSGATDLGRLALELGQRDDFHALQRLDDLRHVWRIALVRHRAQERIIKIAISFYHAVDAFDFSPR
jgi:hypothetical protein